MRAISFKEGKLFPAFEMHENFTDNSDPDCKKLKVGFQVEIFWMWRMPWKSLVN